MRDGFPTLLALIAFACLAFAAIAGIHEAPDVIDPLGNEVGWIPGTPVLWTVEHTDDGPVIEFRDTIWGDYWRSEPDPTTIHDDMDPIGYQPQSIVDDPDPFAAPRVSMSATWDWSRYADVKIAKSPDSCVQDADFVGPEAQCSSSICSSDYWGCLECANLKLYRDRTNQQDGPVLASNDPLESDLMADLQRWSYEVNACYEKYK